MIKNYWGFSNGVTISLELGGTTVANEYYNSIITITEPETTTGSVSAYATYQQLSDPLEFTIAEEVAHNTQVEFILKAWDMDYPDQVDAIDFKLFIKSSIKLQGLIETDTILTADKEYLVDNILIVKHANIIIKPGVTIKFGRNEVLGTEGQIQLYSDEFIHEETGATYIKNSNILAMGTKDSIISFKKDSYIQSAYINARSEGQWGPNQWLQDTNHNYVYDDNGQNILNPNGTDPYYGSESDSQYLQNVISQAESIYMTEDMTVMFDRNDYTWDGNENVLTGTSPRILFGSICNYCEVDEAIEFNYFSLMNSKFPYGNQAYGGDGYVFMYKNNFTGKLFNGNGDLQFWMLSYHSYLNNIANSHITPWSWDATTTTAFSNPMYYFEYNNLFNLSVELWTFIDNQGYNTGLWTPIGFGWPNGFQEFENIWLGAGTIEKLEELNIDAFDGGSGVWEYTNPRLTPYEEAHAVVWKVEVNGINSFDNYMAMYNNPIGIGTHEFKVYFNREMDTSVDPTISYGVTQPFTQKMIDEEGSWSSDGKIYTVNHEVAVGAADGINRIRVTGAIELGDGFEVIKDQLRFNILLQSAGSLSTGFFATPGLGKIVLEWEVPSEDDVSDVLGYNMYRYQVDGDGNEGDPTKINETLIIEDTDDSTTGVYYSDYDVVEGETYFYKYKILRTSFEETDYSNAVSSSPLTSTLGDSNGDFSVDVLDLVHDVDYILGNNPTPFIFVAGDVNADQVINVLDIVGTVDIILSDDGDSSSNSQNINFYPSLPIGYATFSWEGNDLYVESDHNIGGIQLAFDQDFEYVLSEMPGIERLDYQQEDQKILMLYSFNNTTIASNRTKLLTRVDQAQEINIDLAVVGTTSGSKLTPVFEGSDLDDIDAPLQSSELEFLSMIPNPSDGVVTLTYYLPEQMDGVLAKVYDMLGRLVWMQPLKSSEGQSQTQMQLDKLQAGNYIVLISANKQGGLKYLSHKILIIQ